MIILPLKLRKNGFNYTQLLRGKRTCIYRQEVWKDTYQFEVFLIRIAPEKTIKEKRIDAREKFSSNEAFGYWAWSYCSYDEAFTAFKILESGKSTPKVRIEYTQK
jgi:hypothetical protein